MRAGGAQERGLVHPNRAHRRLDWVAEGRVEPGRVLDQRGAAVEDLVHHRPPGHPKLRSDPGDRRVPLADLLERPLPGPLGQTRPGRDRLVPLRPGLDLTQRMRAAPHPLPPAQHHRPPPDRQVTHPDRAAVLRPGNRPAARAADQVRGRLHQQLELAADLRGRHDDEPVQPEQRSIQPRSTVSHRLGSLHGREHLVVITDREGPRPFTRSPSAGVSARRHQPAPSFSAKNRI